MGEGTVSASEIPSACKAARIQGGVRLIAAIDTQTGSVRDVKVASGNPLLTQAAISAVKGWQIRQPSPPKDSVEIGINFEFRCP